MMFWVNSLLNVFLSVLFGCLEYVSFLKSITSFFSHSKGSYTGNIRNATSSQIYDRDGEPFSVRVTKVRKII